MVPICQSVPFQGNRVCFDNLLLHSIAHTEIIAIGASEGAFLAVKLRSRKFCKDASTSLVPRHT
jgi:hypothetical protein